MIEATEVEKLKSTIAALNREYEHLSRIYGMERATTAELRSVIKDLVSSARVFTGSVALDAARAVLAKTE